MNAVAKKVSSASAHDRNLQLKQQKRELKSQFEFLRKVQSLLKSNSLDENGQSEDD